MNLFSRLVVTALPLIPRFLVGRVAARYVAGETREDALRTVREQNDAGAMATLDLLGEEVSEPSKAEAAVEEYVRLFEEIDRRGLDSNVSIKLTLLGLKVDEGLCLDNVEKIATTAKRFGNFVRIDMEDRTCTDATLRIYHQLQPRYGNLGVVLQSYMRRTLRDIDGLPAEGANVRLCKGIYIEPRRIAWKGYETVRLNFIAALDKMLARGVYAGIATHDEYLVAAAVALLDKHGVQSESYEFQMLLGVDEELRRVLLEGGHRLRVYVPYGRDWYSYSIRRLRENPAVARHVMRNFFGLR
ncbi:MAG: proline dehydrogenase family protein [Thermoanaerobaculia bacterium]